MWPQGVAGGFPWMVTPGGAANCVGLCARQLPMPDFVTSIPLGNYRGQVTSVITERNIASRFAVGNRRVD